METTSEIFLDIGSSNVKSYIKKDGQLQPLDAIALPLKLGFNPATGISDANRNRLVNLVRSIQAEYPTARTSVFGTAVFRRMEPPALSRWIADFSAATSLRFNVVSQDEEALYLQKALTGRFRSQDPLLVVNIGGGSTELLVVKSNKIVETRGIAVGVATLNDLFPTVNQGLPGPELFDEIAAYVNSKLPQVEHKTPVAFSTGKELTFMTIARYPLTHNTLFADDDHPFVLSVNGFIARSQEIFNTVTLLELEQLMPENPRWMDGAKVFMPMCKAVFNKYGVETIIPSDSTMIHGIARDSSEGA